MAQPSTATSDLAQRAFHRILLIKPSSLGDIVHALPVLHGLRTRFPEAKIDWLIAAGHAPLIEHHDELDELLLFDRRRLGRLGRARGVAGDLVAFLRELRIRRYDLVVDLQGLFRTGFFARATGAAVRIGFRDAREGAWLFYTQFLPRDPVDTHAVARNYRVASLLGFQDVPITFSLPVTDAGRVEARRLLAACGIEDEDRLVVVAPGARWATKRWAPERFAETIDTVSTQRRVRTVVIGSPDESDVCDAVCRAGRADPVNLAGRTPLGVLAALIERADLVLCHDSAVMHLAVALDRPLVCLIGPTNPHRTGPYHRPVDVIRVPLECSPCYFRELTQCPHRHRCMVELAPAVVVEAVLHRLPADATKSSRPLPASTGR